MLATMQQLENATRFKVESYDNGEKEAEYVFHVDTTFGFQLYATGDVFGTQHYKVKNARIVLFNIAKGNHNITVDFDEFSIELKTILLSIEE